MVIEHFMQFYALVKMHARVPPLNVSVAASAAWAWLKLTGWFS